MSVARGSYRPTDFTGQVWQPARRRFEPLRRVHRSIVLESYWRSGLVALSITVPLTVLGLVLGAQVFQSYGFSLFVGAPFAVGMISVLLFGFSQPKPFGACVANIMPRPNFRACAAKALALALLGVEAVDGAKF